MSNTTVLFRFVLIALFLFSYQSTTIHTKHHHIAELSQCHICKVSKELGTTQHKTLFSQHGESIAVEVSEVEEKRVAKASYDLTQIPELRDVDLDGMHCLCVDDIPSGYSATAPPHIFS